MKLLCTLSVNALMKGFNSPNAVWHSAANNRRTSISMAVAQTFACFVARGIALESLYT